MHFPRHRRITRGPEIRAVAQEGKRIRTTHLEVRALASPLGVSRVGLIVPRHGQTAVARNRLKRRLRELVRTQLLPGAPPADVIVRARREAYRATFAALTADVLRAASQLERLFRAEPPPPAEGATLPPLAATTPLPAPATSEAVTPESVTAEPGERP